MSNKYRKFSQDPLIARIDIPNQVPHGAPLHSSVMTANSVHKAKNKRLLEEARTEKEIARALLQNGTMTYRDMYLLETLLGVGVLTSSQIHLLFWSGKTRNAQRKRLGKLEKLGIIHCNSSYRFLLKGIGLQADNIYGLTSFGMEMLAAYNGRQSKKQIPYDTAYYSIVGNNRLMKHHIMTSQIYTKLKSAARTIGTEMVWINEMSSIIRHAEDDIELVRPDGFFKLYREYVSRTVLGFIETDTRNTEWIKKIRSYEKAFALGRWEENFGSKFPTVFCIVPNNKAVNRVGGLIRKHRENVHYLVKSWQKLQEEDAFVNWYIPQLDEYYDRWLPEELDY